MADRLRDDRLQPSPGPSHLDLRAAARAISQAEALDRAMQVGGSLPHYPTVFRVPGGAAFWCQCACGFRSYIFDDEVHAAGWVCEMVDLEQTQDRRTERLRGLGVRV